MLYRKKTTPHQDFWVWFQKSRFLSTDGQQAVEKLGKRANTIHDSIVFEIGPPDQRPHELIMSADGIREAVEHVEALADAAPPQPHTPSRVLADIYDPDRCPPLRIIATISSDIANATQTTIDPGSQPARSAPIGAVSTNASSGGFGWDCHTRKYLSLPRNSPSQTHRTPTSSRGTRPSQDRFVAARTAAVTPQTRPIPRMVANAV
jgi:hypothetical protein